MTAVAITQVSSVGQFSLPEEICKMFNLTAGSELFVMTDGDTILMKPVKEDKLARFERLSDESISIALENGISENQVNDIIREVRGE